MRLYLDNNNFTNFYILLFQQQLLETIKNSISLQFRLYSAVEATGNWVMNIYKILPPLLGRLGALHILYGGVFLVYTTYKIRKFMVIFGNIESKVRRNISYSLSQFTDNVKHCLLKHLFSQIIIDYKKGILWHYLVSCSFFPVT